MAYSKLNLVNGTTLDAEHLAHIESGIADAIEKAEEAQETAANAGGLNEQEVLGAVETYMAENPIETGATAAQVAQIESNTAAAQANAQAIEALKESASPIKYIQSLEEASIVNLRDLESGTYVLYGYFRTHAGASTILTFPSNLLVNIITKTAGTHVQVFYPVNNVVQFLAIMVDGSQASGYSVQRTDVNLNQLAELTGRVLPTGGTAGQVLTVGEDGAAAWAAAETLFPSGEEATF